MAKPFHVGHLRSTIIGNALANCHQALGAQVTRINYLGDWGRQFGLVDVGFQRFGSDALLEQDPLRHLFDVYVRANTEAEKDPALLQAARAIHQQLERFPPWRSASSPASEPGAVQAAQLWARLRSISLSSYERIYQRLQVRFDRVEGEHMYVEAGAVLGRRLARPPYAHQEENGAWVATLESLAPFVLLKGDGTTTYLLRDLAAALERASRQPPPDVLLYVAGQEQELHFRQLQALLRVAGHDVVAARLSHVGFGLVQGMSTRKGQVIFLDALLEQATERMLILNRQHAREKQEPGVGELGGDQTAQQLALSALVVQDLKNRRIKDYQFDLERMLSHLGDTGSFLQYTHARLTSLERRAAVRPADPTDMDVACLAEPVAQDLIFELSKFEMAVVAATTASEPSILVQHLFRLARCASSAHAALRVQDQPEPQAAARLTLFALVRCTLADGLRLLGLTPLAVV
jgi:arginyl-tRNA synthetase